MYVIELKDLPGLFSALRSRGFTVIGPTLRDGAIVLDAITGVDDLPRGWTDVQVAAGYQVRKRKDEALFGFSVSPMSWKKFLFPPRVKLFAAERSGKGFVIAGDKGGQPSAPAKLAFLGLRSCELHALAIHDKVFASGQYADTTYTEVRKSAIVIAVNCTAAGGTCFCDSMGTGPRAASGYDIALTEILADGRHHFLAEGGTPLGESVLADVPRGDAAQDDRARLEEEIAGCRASMGRSMNTDGIARLLSENFDHQEWDLVAKRCLTCTNCTLVCPTCFCSTVEDVTDLSGVRAERWRRWDSCFTLDFTKVAGGIIRPSAKARYRQWMMHKLSYWENQFGVLGCVGCGRCITWCPVGIDITAEAETIRGNAPATAAVPEQSRA